MPEFLAAILLLVLGGAAAIALRRQVLLGRRAGQTGAIVGGAVGLAGALRVLAFRQTEDLWAASFMPGGAIHLQLDPLSAFFLLPVFGLSMLTAIYGGAYMAGRGEPGRAAASWFHVNLLTAGMAAVIAAHDGLLFLLAWEIMALAPFFLVVFEDREPAVRHAGWTYLAATHLGTAFLLVLFVLLGERAGNSDFDAYPAALQGHPDLCSLAFLLALLGFGSKAGIVPAHVWLPEAHPVAPSHASALMSGAMIKVGIYGLVRIMTMLGTPAPWWGWVLVAIGAASGVLGVLFALAQHDLKRLLAYSSVENIGIILLGIGLGLLGAATGTPLLAAVGFTAALLHVLNHSVFKGLLFLAAGAVQHGAHSLDFGRLGGLLKRMKWTGAAFLVGAAAIVGLPPLSGFISEYLLFYAGFGAVVEPTPAIAATGLFTIIVLGLISGLAAACFAKAFGVVFLGSPRSPEAEEAHESAPSMTGPMAALACLCVLIGLAAPALIVALQPVVAIASGLPAAVVQLQVGGLAAPLTLTVALFAATTTLAAVLWWWRGRALGRAGVRRGLVWGCGYLFPSPRMQYTASSFVQPVTTQFRLFVQNRETVLPPQGYFPRSASYSSDSGDPLLRLLFIPTFRWFDRVASRLNVIQRGHTHIYVLYVAATLVVLLVWASL